jgi:hypothetical protein
MISLTLSCRIDQRCAFCVTHPAAAISDPATRSETCGPKQEEFIKRCFYTAGQYDATASFDELSAELSKHEVGRAANRIFYLSIPPTVFVAVAQNAARCASSTTGAAQQHSAAPRALPASPRAALTSMCALARGVHQATRA